MPWLEKLASDEAEEDNSTKSAAQPPADKTACVYHTVLV
jgi:hypothetical protein